MYTAQGTLDRSAAIVQHGNLVRRVANQMISRLPANVEMDDLVQAGMIGLMDALSRFDPSQGFQFETFATQRVKGAMLDALRGTDWLPRSVRKNQRSISKAIHTLEQRFKRSPLEAEIAVELSMSLQDYQEMLADSKGGQLVYLDEFGDVSGDGDDRAIDPNLLDHSKDPADQLRDARFRSALAGAIAELPQREKMFMSMYYEQDLNLKEIGAVLGVTESRACQLHSQAVGRLRVKLKNWSG